MSKYKDLAKKALSSKKIENKSFINENMLYAEGITERMHPDLEKRLREGKHSLAGTNIFPEGDVISGEMKLIRERFKEVVMRCREAFGMDVVDDRVIKREQMPLVMESMEIEGTHKKKLEQLAVEMIIEEFNIPEGSIEFEAVLQPNINRNGTIDTPQETETEFDSHDDIVSANKEVNKRRVLNAMIQGASNSVNHMFHLKNDELRDMDPRLPGNYKKMMSAADYMYYIVPDLNGAVNGGSCEVEYNEDEEGIKPVIKAKAMVFPVLVHELCKGIMEVLSGHGLPTQENITEYVINKADFIQAEPDDMRFGPGLWRKFCDCIPPEDFNIKHHAYVDLVQLPPDEFNHVMKEMIAGTKLGKSKINEMLSEAKREIQEDEYNQSMKGRDDLFDIEDLL